MTTTKRYSHWMIALCFPVAGCGSQVTSAEPPPAPGGVSNEDHLRCHAIGQSAGQQALHESASGWDTFATLTGGLGAIIALSAVDRIANDAYRTAYDDCLRESIVQPAIEQP